MRVRSTGVVVAPLVLAVVTVAPTPALAGSRTGALQQLHLMSAEPPTGGMRFNQVIFVDDHTCPAGMVKMVTAPSRYNGPRQRSCVPR